MKMILRQIRHCLLMTAFIAIGFLAAAQPAGASESKAINITKCEGTGPDEMSLQVTLPDSFHGSYNVYRASSDPSAGGVFTLIDTISKSGNTWTTNGGGYWYTYFNNKKIACYSSDPALSGNVLFLDSELQLNQKYYYKIVLEDDWDQETVTSNIVSGKTILTKPELLKCYAKTNSSVYLSWQKSEKAQGYVLYRKSGKKWTKIKTISKASKTTFTDNKVKSGKTYHYRIRSYCKIKGSTIFSAYSTSLKIKTGSPSVKGTYSAGSVYGPSLSTSKLTEVRRVVQSFKDNYIRKNMSDYDKVLAAFNFVRANCKYAWRGWQYNNANTAWGALIYGEAQCSGYARAMKALCDAIGVPCRYVHANSKASNPNHQWNQVKVGGKWYILDAQGGAFLLGSTSWKNYYRMDWNTKGLPKCSKSSHKKGGMAPSEV